MKRIFALLLLLLFLPTSCDELDDIERAIRNEEREARRAGVRLEDIVKTNHSEQRAINISEHITEDEFAQIVNFVLSHGSMDLHGTRFGFLPSLNLSPWQIWLIPEWDFFRELQGSLREEHNAISEDIELDAPDYTACLFTAFSKDLPIPIHESWKNGDRFSNIAIVNNIDILDIRRYDIVRERDSSGNLTGDYTLSIRADMGITDEQILAQFLRYLNVIRNLY